MHTCLSILITLLLSVLGFSPDAKADVRDHLGSTRAVIDEAGELLQTVNGLNLYDFHARWQDHATGRFTTQDPLAEKYYALSPYTYCAGNPIMLIDPTGMRFEYAEDMTPKQREQLDVGYVC